MILSVLVKEDDSMMPIGEGMRELFANRNYVWLFVCFNFLYGLYSAIASSITSFTTPYGFTPSDNSIICLVFLISGILFSFFIGTILDKYQCYKKSLVGICVSSLLTLSLTFYGLPHRELTVEAIIMMLTGAALIPIVTICFSLAAELTYPVPEVYSIGILISSG
jgi:predicted MFS family arabinose efflux permease